MEYKCPICGDKENNDIGEYIAHTEEHIMKAIKEKHPEWVEKDGVCRKCLDYYHDQIKGTSK